MFASIAHAHFGEKSGASEWVDVNNLLKVIWLLVKSCWDLLSIEHQTCVVHMAIPMQQTPSGATLKVSAYWPQFMLMAVILRSFDKHLSRPCTLVQRWSFRTWARYSLKGNCKRQMVWRRKDDCDYTRVRPITVLLRFKPQINVHVKDTPLRHFVRRDYSSFCTSRLYQQ